MSRRLTLLRKARREGSSATMRPPDAVPAPPQADGDSLRAAQRVLWRAWRHMEDHELADRVFDLLADEPIWGRRLTARALLRWFVPPFTPAELRGALLAGLFVGTISGITTGSVAAIVYLLDGDPSGALLAVLFAAALLGLTGALVSAIFLGLLASLVGALLGGAIGALAAGPLGAWLGAVAGGLVGSLGASLDGFRGDIHAWHYRSWFEWWGRRPSTPEVVQALRRVAARHPRLGRYWRGSLTELAAGEPAARPLAELAAALDSPSWGERLVARHALMARGGEAVPTLAPLLHHRRRRLRIVALHLIDDIARETRGRLGPRLSRLLCPDCLARPCRHRVRVPFDLPRSYEGCRWCHRSRDLLECGQVVAVLDAGMSQALRQVGNALHVNALARAAPLDLDQVEIRRATDEQVERFALRIASDPDRRRRRQCRRARCLLAPDVRLSENTMRILRRVFGEVVGEEGAPAGR